MPRTARIDTPGLLHHIMIRGIERRRIFSDNKDRDNFMDRLSQLLPESKTQCYAWAFLPNHAHFLMRSGPNGIAGLMRRLLTGYAVFYNKRHKRHGQLFQNRYKSIVCQEDAYLLELVRYIHLNPLRSKLVADLHELNEFPYAGHSALMGRIKREWQDVDYVLGFFGKQVTRARNGYLSHVEKGIHLGRRQELVGGGLIRSLGGWEEVKNQRLEKKARIKSDQRILGDSEFVSGVLSESQDHFTRKYSLKMQGYDFKKLLDRVSFLLDIEKDHIIVRGKQKPRVRARDLLCYWGVDELGMTMADLAERLEMTPSAVSYAVRRGESIAKAEGYQLEFK